MIRTVHPEVVTALSTEGQGGGQHHQASAVLAREAYAAAADPSRFPEQIKEGLRPWQPRKFYFSAGFPFGFRGASSSADAGLSTVDLGEYDSLLGRTYAEIWSHARSMHKCQGMSPLIAFPGASVAQYRLAARHRERLPVVSPGPRATGLGLTPKTGRPDRRRCHLSTHPTTA